MYPGGAAICPLSDDRYTGRTNGERALCQCARIDREVGFTLRGRLYRRLYLALDLAGALATPRCIDAECSARRLGEKECERIDDVVRRE